MFVVLVRLVLAAEKRSRFVAKLRARQPFLGHYLLQLVLLMDLDFCLLPDSLVYFEAVCCSFVHATFAFRTTVSVQ